MTVDQKSAWTSGSPLDHREFLGLLGLKILIVILVGTATVMGVTALTVDLCYRWRSRHALVDHVMTTARTAGAKNTSISARGHCAPRRMLERLMRRFASRTSAKAMPTMPPSGEFRKTDNGLARQPEHHRRIS